MVRISLKALAVVALLFSACSNNSTGAGDTESPAGRTVGHTGCKTILSSSTSGNAATDQACLDYAYDGQSGLQLRHVNAVFNCCPDSVGGEIRIENHTITIDESEWLSNPCDCVCPFDVDYQVVDLPPGVYTIRVNEMYLPEGADLLEFTVDLRVTPSGSFCVARELPVVGAE
jgi:hypothetical protein